MPTRPPNILLVCSDQEVAHPDLPPSLDLPGHERLRAAGTSFTNYHVTTAPCTPSRGVIYTGRHTQANGMISNIGVPPHCELPTAMPTIGHMLRDQGYYTAYKGKWHLGRSELPELANPLLWPTMEDALEPYGFSDYSVEGDRWGRTWDGFTWDRAVAADAGRWLWGKGKALADDGRPWCLAVNFVNPHDIMFYLACESQHASRLHYAMGAPLKGDPPVPPYDKFWDVDLPASFADDLDGKPWCQHNFKTFWSHFLGEIDPGDREAWRRFRSYYYNCIRDVDLQLQTVLDALEASGQAERTAIVYTSDHGELGGAHGLREKGANIYRENLRVPLIVCHPDQSGGGETAALGSALDLLPTLLALAGADAADIRTRNPDLFGHDLTPAIAGRATARDEAGILFYYGVLLGAYDADQFRDTMIKVFAGEPPTPAADGAPQPLHERALIRGIHAGRHKFARYFAPAEHHVPTDWQSLCDHNDLELYDLEDDPDEMTNLARAPADHRDLLLSLNDRLNTLIAAEIGADDGREFPGPPSLYTLAP